ncbi:hypothetical protein [Haladaptatus caseinilyticus]|uniref:hypothetical protein n=1 Tax=Haladaptatus caseinilyticus TaxID=2993314 RepID=UPI00224B8894|nr:hypothetical protein [Haladaptatus caseinilyticus]
MEFPSIAIARRNREGACVGGSEATSEGVPTVTRGMTERTTVSKGIDWGGVWAITVARTGVGNCYGRNFQRR